MQYNTLIQNIQADIYSNGAELITGDILQSVLLQMVSAWAGAGAMYGGVITPASAAPADLDQATVYLALTAGTYTNFVDSNNDPIVTTGPALITYDGGASLVFSKTDLPAGGGGCNYVTITSATTDVVIPGDQSNRDAINLLISYAYDYDGSTTYYLGILSFATSDLHDQSPLLQTLRTDSGGEIGSWLVGVISGSGEVFIQPNDINSGDVEVNIYDLDGVQLEVRQSGDADYPTASDFTDVALSDEVRIQEELISGTNIKTINSQSLLGGGDIIIREGANFVSFDSDTNLAIVPGKQNERNTVNLLISYAYNEGNDTSYHLSILSFATSALDNTSPVRQILRNDMTEIGSWLVGKITATGEIFVYPNDLNRGDVKVYVYDMDGIQLELRSDEDEGYPTNADFNNAILSVDDKICDCVKFTPQTLTEEQKAQARENIGATAPEVFWATYGTTTFAEVGAALAAGKMVACKYDGIEYALGGLDTNYYFYSAIVSRIWRLSLSPSNNWTKSNFVCQTTDNRASSITSSNYNSSSNYPSLAALNGSLYKWGVISQTQTWTTVPSVNAPGVYAMSNLVMGLIPQANIDLYEAAGATFNTSTGYFELNGLTDISYNEMSAIYAQNVPNPWNGQQCMFSYPNIRTNIPPKNNIGTITAFNGLRLAYDAGKIERIVLKSNVYKVQINNLQLAFFNLYYLSDVPDEIDVTNATNFSQTFQSCYSLKEIRLYKLKASLTFAACSGLSKDSLLYMINNSQTTAFTITLHASVYAKTQVGGEWYSDISTALAAHTNVTLASA